MGNMKQFKRQINALGGVWCGDRIMFNALPFGFYAAYRPLERRSDRDIIIFWNGEKGYLLIGKYKSSTWKDVEFQNYKNLRKYVQRPKHEKDNNKRFNLL